MLSEVAKELLAWVGTCSWELPLLSLTHPCAFLACCHHSSGIAAQEVGRPQATSLVSSKACATVQRSWMGALCGSSVRGMHKHGLKKNHAPTTLMTCEAARSHTNELPSGLISGLKCPGLGSSRLDRTRRGGRIFGSVLKPPIHP